MVEKSLYRKFLALNNVNDPSEADPGIAQQKLGIPFSMLCSICGTSNPLTDFPVQNFRYQHMEIFYPNF